MRAIALPLFLLGLALVSVPATTQGQPAIPVVSTNAPPAWIDAGPPAGDGSIPPGSESHGSFIILFDQQINASTAERYTHVIKKINNESGVQSGANLSLAYDPSYQKLVVHQVVIHRNGQSIDLLEPAKFKIIQQETDLDRQIYNGTLSAVLFLEDVRAGDIIEYSYTLGGEDPGWHGRYAEMFLAGLPAPVQHLRHRVLWPKNRDLFFKSFGISAEPQIKTFGDDREYVWEWQDVPAIDMEDQVPPWFPAYPYVQISSFKDWAEVSTWASELFAGTNLDTPQLQAQIAELRQSGATPEQSVQSALNFVQSDIRYLGIEIGEKSFRPTDPATVLRRRFGDCKDKAFLLSTLLHGLGFEATPVLVGTGYRRTLPDLLPSPNVFNHAIVQVVTGGATYWIDPTASYQRGPLTGRFRPDYGFGLLTRPGETNLTPIPASSDGWPETRTVEDFQVAGQKSPAALTVTTTYNGSDAEWMRAVIASAGQEALQKSYLDDYTRLYPGTTSRGRIDVIDFKDADSVMVTEHYSITNFWILSVDKLRYECRFYPLGIHYWIAKPATLNRSQPLEIAFPRQRTVETRVHLPREFRLSNNTNVFEGPATKLLVRRSVTPRSVDLKYVYRSTTNFVSVSSVAAHLKSQDEMENAINYSLTWQNVAAATGQRFNWPVFLLATIYALGCAVALVMVYHRQSRVVPSVPELMPALHPELVGLGGWLVWVAIRLCLGPILVVIQIFRGAGSFSGYKWQAMTLPGGVSYSPLWAPLLCFELLAQITLLAIMLFALVLFFQKRRSFPNWFIILVVVDILYYLADHFAAHSMSKTPAAAASTGDQRALLQILFSLFVWIPYIRISRRVKATFTN